jgi:hypothetical protein
MTKVLAKLHKITVINVQTITTTLSLGTCTETTSEEVAFQETDDRFTVLVGSAGNLGKSINLPICRALSRLLDIEMMTLHSCITHPVDVVKGLFEFNGIAEYPVDDGYDRSWLQAMTQPNVPVVPLPVVPERSPSPVPPASPPPGPPAALSVHNEGHFPPLNTPPSNTPPSNSREPSVNGRRRRQRSVVQGSVAPSEHSQFTQTSRSSYISGPPQAVGPASAPRDTARLSAQMGALVNNNQMVPNSPAGPVWPAFPNFNMPVSSEETDMVGIMGEHFVRRFFHPYSASLNGENRLSAPSPSPQKGIQASYPRLE